MPSSWAPAAWGAEPGSILLAGGWKGGWVDGWMGGWVDGWMGGWVDGWMGGWVDGWMGGWVDGRWTEMDVMDVMDGA